MTRIDPSQLLNTMSVLLGHDGGIRSIDEVPRIVQLMHKFSKKLVSKCIYIHILRSSSPDLLEQFLSKNGWELLNTWFLEAYSNENLHLCGDLVRLFALCPMTSQRLKLSPERNQAPKILRQLSTDSRIEAEVRNLATQVVTNWLRIARKKPMDSDFSSEETTGGSIEFEEPVQEYDADHSEDYVPPVKKVKKSEKKVVSTVKNNKVVKKVANKEAKKGPVKKLIKKLDAPPSGNDSVDDLLDGSSSESDVSSDEEMTERQRQLQARLASYKPAGGGDKKKVIDLTSSVKTSPSAAAAKAKFEEREKEIRRRREAAAAKARREERAKPYSRTELRKELPSDTKDKIKQLAQQLKEEQKQKPVKKLARIPKLPKKEVEKTEDSGKTDSFGSMMGSLDSKPKPKVMPTKNKNKDLLASLAGTPKEKPKSKSEIEKELKEKERVIQEQMKQDAKIEQKIKKEEEEKKKEAVDKEKELKNKENGVEKKNEKEVEEEKGKKRERSDSDKSDKEKKQRSRIRKISSSSSGSSSSDEERKSDEKKKESVEKKKESDERKKESDERKKESDEKKKEREDKDERRKKRHKEESKRRDKDKRNSEDRERRNSEEKSKERRNSVDKDKERRHSEDKDRKGDKKDDRKDDKKDRHKLEKRSSTEEKRSSTEEKRSSAEEKSSKKVQVIKESNMFGDLLSSIMKEDKQKSKKRRPSEKDNKEPAKKKEPEAEDREKVDEEKSDKKDKTDVPAKVEDRLSPVLENKESEIKKENDPLANNKSKKGILVYGRLFKSKKSIKWAAEDSLVQIEYFEMNEDERTNVFKQKLNFQERLKQEKIMEKNKINQDWTKLQDDSYTQENGERLWKLTRLDLEHPVEYGCESKEKDVQTEREKTVLRQLLFNNALPPDPSEPDNQPRSHSSDSSIQPKAIPQIDLAAPDTITDFTEHGWSSQSAPKISLPPPTPAQVKQKSSIQDIMSTFKPGLLENIVNIAKNMASANNAAGADNNGSPSYNSSPQVVTSPPQQVTSPPPMLPRAGNGHGAANRPKFTLPKPVSVSQKRGNYNGRPNGQYDHNGRFNRQRPTCKFYMERGRCSKGERCDFEHATPRSR